MEREMEMNFDREMVGLEPIIKEEMIMIKKSEYKDLLITQGKYDELKHISNQIFSLITPNDFKILCDHILTKKDIKELKQQGVKI